MDKTPNNSIFNERQFFLTKLKKHPLFLLKHLPSLSNVICKRYLAKSLNLLRGQHKNTKKHPPWLSSISDLGDSYYIHFYESLQNMPARTISTHEIMKKSDKTNQTNIHVSDHEDYLAQHRWGILLEEILFKSPVNTLPISIDSWLKTPPAKDNAAWETYSACERIANLLTWLAYLPIDKRMNHASPEIYHFIQHSLQWIFNHLEYYGEDTNNHILNNARALIMGGVILKNASAVKAGMLIFQNMLPILIQSQGALRERSTHYQLVILKWLLDAFSFLEISPFCRQHDLDFINDYLTRVRNVAASFCDDKGYLHAFIGDISPDASPEQSAKLLLALYPAFWPKITPFNSIKYDDWYLLENTANKLLLNCPQGHYPNQCPTHGHGDILSFVWLHEQQPILIDCGRARYTKDVISLQQKSANGHNLPLVNDLAPMCESFVISGNWWPRPYANAHIQICKPTNDVIHIKHNGFKRATSVNTHQREISIHPHGIHICDKFIGTGKVKIDIIWQLHPLFYHFDQQAMQFISDKKIITLKINSAQMPDEVNYFLAPPSSGWYSSEYGMAIQNPILFLTWIVSLPFEIEMIFKANTCVV